MRFDQILFNQNAHGNPTYSFIRIPPHQSVEVECLAGDAIKIGVCYYIDAPEVIT